MTGMVEKVARAIREHRTPVPHGDRERASRDLARVAIAAMREPTKEMLSDEYPLGAPPQALDSWRDMIDAALKESS